MRKISLILILCSLLMVGCTTTEYITPELPTFTPIRPERPQLLTITEQIPAEVNINLVMMMSYSKQLEAYADGWEGFYQTLMEGNHADNSTN